MNSVTFQSSNVFANLHPLQAAFERMFSGEMSNQKNNPSAMPCQSAESPMPCPNPACRPCPPGPSPIADRGNLLEDNMRSKNETRLWLISSINLVTDKPKASAKHWCFLLSKNVALSDHLRSVMIRVRNIWVCVAWALIRM